MILFKYFLCLWPGLLLRILSFQSVLGFSNILCLEIFRFNTFFDQGVHVFYHYLHWLILFYFISYNLLVKLDTEIPVWVTKLCFPFFSYFLFSLLILSLLASLGQFSSLHPTAYLCFHRLIKGLFISALNTSSVFITSILNLLSCVPTTLLLSGPTVLVFLGFTGDKSCGCYWLFLCWNPGIWVWDHCKPWCWYLILSLLVVAVLCFLLPSLVLRRV